MTTRNLIIAQRQPGPTSCVQTCIAMCLGLPAEDVIHRYGDLGMSHRELLSALEECRVLHNLLVFPTLIVTGWYFATTPSLTRPGGSHQILIHFDHDDGSMRVVDPNGFLHENGSNLMSFGELVLFHPGGALRRSK